MVRNLHLQPCLFLEVSYFESMYFFCFVKKYYWQKITWEKFKCLWGCHLGLSSVLLVLSLPLFLSCCTDVSPVIKLSFLLHVVRQGEGNDSDCIQGGGFRHGTVERRCHKSEKKRDAHAMLSLSVTLRGVALLLGRVQAV